MSDLDNMTLTALRAKASGLGVKSVMSKSKAQLIAALADTVKPPPEPARSHCRPCLCPLLPGLALSLIWSAACRIVKLVGAGTCHSAGARTRVSLNACP